MFFLFIDGRINRLFRSKNQQTKKEFLARTFFWISFQAKKTKKKTNNSIPIFFFPEKTNLFCLFTIISLSYYMAEIVVVL